MATPSLQEPRPLQRPASDQNQCPQCHNRYSRRDHLLRHMRSHAKGRPLSCTICGRGFFRRDLLLRHSLLHKSSRPGRVSSSSAAGHSVPSRVQNACQPCASAKVRCSDEKPCSRCRDRGIDCVNLAKHSTVDEILQHSIGSEDALQSWDGDILEEMGLDGLFDAASDGHNLEDIRLQGPELQLSDSRSTTVPRPSQPCNEIEDLDFYQDSSFIVGNVSPWTLALTSEPPIDTSHLLPPDNFGASVECEKWNEARNGMDWMQKAFQESPFYSRCWTEINRGSSSGLHPLTMPDIACVRSLSANTWPIVPQMFDQPIRDGLLAMVVAGQGPSENIMATGITCSFPSAELMDILADRFLTKQRHKLDCWIHTETFHPAIACPELTLMVLAAGAFGTQIFDLRQWAYMVCRFMKRTLVLKLEDRCDPFEVMPLLQALLICLEVDSWNCDNSCLFRSGSPFDVIRDLLRRAPGPNRPAESVAPQPEDQGTELKAKWDSWIISEGYKRLAGRFCTFENQKSAALNVRPSMLSSELDISLPQPRALWMAKSALEWKDIYLALPSGDNSPRVRDLLSLLPTRPFPVGFFDETFAVKLSAHFLEGLIISNQLLSTIFANTDVNAGVVVPVVDADIPLWKRDIRAATETIRAVLRSRYRSTVSANSLASFTTSYLFMILNASINDLEVLCGRDGTEESNKKHHALQTWACSQGARESIWHAGQILKHLRYVQRPLSGFIVIIAYQATLVLLAYCRLRKGHASEIFEATTTADITVTLNGREAPCFESFIRDGVGRPALQYSVHGSATAIADLNPKVVVQVVMETLFHETFDAEQIPQLLTRGLLQLLRDIASCTTADELIY